MQKVAHYLSRVLIFLIVASHGLLAEPEPRETISLDAAWRFSLGHATDPKQDFDHGTGYFSYLAKTGYGDGPAAASFDDRGWRRVDLPHDWALRLQRQGESRL